MYIAIQRNFLLLSLLTFTFSLGIISSIPYSEVDTGKKYGDPCEGKEYCQGELVACREGSCSCFAPEDMIYDEFSNGCMVLAMKKCVLNSQVSVNCIDDAFCDASGLCLCSEGFFPSTNGSCVRKKLYKESCNTDHECDSSSTKSLVCIDGACTCDKRGITITYSSSFLKDS